MRENRCRENPLVREGFGTGGGMTFLRMREEYMVSAEADYSKAAIFSGSFGTTIGRLAKVDWMRAPSGASSCPVW
jgi:hypothetical protein